MASISIKQNNKGTFLDLSKEEIKSTEFIDEFNKFTSQVKSFLSGSSVSLIVPDNMDQDQETLGIMEQVRSELNKNNISLKSILSSDESLAMPTTGKREIKPMKEEVQEKQEEQREIVDTTQLPETLYVEANLRSGQLIRYPGNIFILGDVNPSAEIIAAGDIIVWGNLRGVAHAGADGDRNAKIIALDISTGQIRIADEIAALDTRMFKKSENKGLNLASLLGEKQPEGFKVPLLAKIRNNEIIISRYFEV